MWPGVLEDVAFLGRPYTRLAAGRFLQVITTPGFELAGAGAGAAGGDARKPGQKKPGSELSQTYEMGAMRVTGASYEIAYGDAADAPYGFTVDEYSRAGGNGDRLRAATVARAARAAARVVAAVPVVVLDAGGGRGS
jgi:hypothetical protein